MWKEFKAFAIKGSVLDMAIGIIIGAAFGTIVKSLVDDVVMPPIGLLISNIDFKNLFIVIKPGIDITPPYATIEAANEAGAVTINWGRFINNILTFLIVAFSVFLMVKGLNRLKKKEENIPAGEPVDKDCPYCTTKIPIKAIRCPNCTSELK